MVIFDFLIRTYNLSAEFFIVVFIASLAPFYFGYFLMLFGTTRNLGWGDIFFFRLTPKFNWNTQTICGFVIHVIGRLAPYLYILIYGVGLPAWIYAAVIVAMLLTLFLLLKKIFWNRRAADLKDVTIVGKDTIEAKDAAVLWKIYNDTFAKINKISPCRQSFDEVHFMETLSDTSVRKYVLTKKTEEIKEEGKDATVANSAPETIIGIALVTNDFKNLPWISWEYFQEHFPDEFSKKLIYYFIGLAIDRAYRGNSYSISLIEHIIDDIPAGGIMGFDHSRNINPMLHHFTRIVRQAKTIHRLHLDRQHYHLVRRK